MKRVSCGAIILAICVSAISGPRAEAQDDRSRAAAIADRDAAEERYRRLNTAVEGLLAAQAEQQRRLETLVTELRQVRAESAQPKGDFVTREELKQLVDTVREIDRKREADRRMILEEIENLGKSLAASFKAATPRRTEPDKSTTSTPAYEEVAEHKVEQGQTLSAIVAAYNAEYKKQGKRTSLKLVLDANPNIKPEAMAVGQKVVVPLVPN
jgi:hypothetical protein